MTTARAILISGFLVAIAVTGSAWWIVASDHPQRYQLVNVGKGETQRIDLETGTITRCAYRRCEALTKGAAVIEKPDEWPGEVVSVSPATPGP